MGPAPHRGVDEQQASLLREAQTAAGAVEEQVARWSVEDDGADVALFVRVELNRTDKQQRKTTTKVSRQAKQ